MKFNAFVSVSAVALIAASMSAAAQETVKYKYDALGRLVKVDYDANGETTTNYNYDAAGNRTSVVTTGASAAPTAPLLDKLAASFEIDAGVAQNGLSWSDTAGTGVNLVASGDPQLATGSTPTGQSAFVLDGNGDKFEYSGASLANLPGGATKRSLFFVVDYVNTANAQANDHWAGVAYGEGAPNEAFGLTVNGNANNLAVQGWGANQDKLTSVSSGNDQDNDEWFVQSAHWDGSHITLYKDAAALTYVPPATTQRFDYNTETGSAGKFVIGQEISQTGSDGYRALKVAAVLLYEDLTVAEHQNVISYLRTKYINGGANTAPVATADTKSTANTQPITFDPRANDSDADGHALTITSVSQPPSSQGSVAVNNGASLTFTPNTTYVGTSTFNYTISDGNGGSATAAVTVNVTSVGSVGAPVTNGLVASFESSDAQPTNGSTVTGWSDGSGSGLNLIAVGGPLYVTNATPTNKAAIRLDGVDDKLELKGDNALQSLPDNNDNRSVYVVIDHKNSGDNAWAGFSYGKGANNQAYGLVVNGANNNLTAQGWGGGNDLVTNEQAAGGWIVHSSILDNSDLTMYKDTQQIGNFTHSYATNVGDIVDDANGVSKIVLGEEIAGAGYRAADVSAVLIYDRALTAGEHQQVVEYLKTKYIGSSSTPNSAPVANNDTGATTAGQAVTINVIANDTDADNNPLTVTGVTQPATGGTVSIGSNGNVTYTPANGFVGNASFTYTVSDGTAQDTATVAVTVSAASQGSIPSNVPFNGELAAYFDSQAITQSANTVTSWQGAASTGNGFILSASGAPTATTTPTGKTAISFDGVNDKLEKIAGLSGLPGGNSNRSMYLVVNHKTAPNNFPLNQAWAGASYGAGGTDQAFGLVVNGQGHKLTVQAWGANDQTSNVTIDNNWLVHSAIVSNSSITQYKDDNATPITTGVVNLQTNVTANNSQFVLGKSIDDERFRASDIAAVLIYDRALTTTEHQQVVNYLRSEYITGGGGSGGSGGGMPTPVFEQTGSKTYNGAAGSVDEYAPTGALNISNGTIAFSFKDANPGTRQGLVVKDASGYAGGGHHFGSYIENNKLVIRFQDNDSQIVYEHPIVANQEYEVAATFSQTNGIEAFVNGVSIGSQANFMMDWQNNNEWMQVGGLGWASNTGQAGFVFPLSGQIADVQIFDQALTGAQISTLAGQSSMN